MDSDIYPNFRDPFRLSDYEVLCSLSLEAAVTDEERSELLKFQSVIRTLEWLEFEITKQRDQCNTNSDNFELVDKVALSIVKLERRIDAANRQIKNLLKIRALQTMSERERQHVKEERNVKTSREYIDRIRESAKQKEYEHLSNPTLFPKKPETISQESSSYFTSPILPGIQKGEHQQEQKNTYFIGQILSEYIGYQDAAQFDMTDGGSYMLLLLSSPTNAEVKSFYESPTKIRLSVFKHAMWLTIKFGDLDWQEAPFSPHLALRLTIPQGLAEASKGMIVMLINTLDGRILGMLEIDFSEQFRIVLESAIVFFRNQPFNQCQYDAFLEQVKKTYKPSEIAEKAIAETDASF